MQEFLSKEIGEDGKPVRYLSVQLNALHINAALDCKFFIRLQNKNFVKYRDPGLPFHQGIRDRLIQNGHEFIFVSSEDVHHLEVFLEKNLKQTLTDPKVDVHEKSETLYNTTTFLTKSLLSDPNSTREINLARKVVNHSVEFIGLEPEATRHLFDISSMDYYTYTHMVHVMIYSVSIGKAMGYKMGPELQELGYAALLHDIGKSFIGQNILQKQGPLSHTEFTEMKRHAELGFKALQQTRQLPGHTLNTVLRHHERLDGQGYPSGWNSTQLDLDARIVTCADIFDALTTKRVYRDTMKTFPAMKIMKEYVGSRIDHRVFKSFVKILGEF